MTYSSRIWQFTHRSEPLSKALAKMLSNALCELKSVRDAPAFLTWDTELSEGNRN